jgi:hypothetical protein
VRRAADNLGHRVFFVSLVAPDSLVPDAGSRRQFIDRISSLLALCEAFFFLVEGRTVASALHRTIARATIAMSPYRRRINVIGSLDAVLDALGDKLDVSRAAVHAAAERLRESRPATSGPRQTSGTEADRTS